jgi:hypothetical protein
MQPRSIREAFEGMEEPRDGRNLKYPLIDVLELAACGTPCGHADLANMAYFPRKKEGEPAERFGLAAGVPSHDVLGAVFRLPVARDSPAASRTGCRGPCRGSRASTWRPAARR